MNGWKHSITLRLSVAFATLATVVFTALGLYFSRAADAHMAELDAHDLFGKLALIGHVGTQAHSAEAFAARLGDALIGEHGVIVTVDGEKGPIFKWPDAHLAAPLAAKFLERRLAGATGAERRPVVASLSRVYVASGEPDRAEYQRDLSVSYNKMGDLYRALGQGERAREVFQKSLDIIERLAP